MNQTQHVIMMNDFPVVVCPLGTTLKQAQEMAAAERNRYLIRNPHVEPDLVHFQVHMTPVKTYREVVS